MEAGLDRACLLQVTLRVTHLGESFTGSLFPSKKSRGAGVIGASYLMDVCII